MKKTCYNCEHYMDMCACDWIEDIEKLLIGASILKNDHWLYGDIEGIIEENSVLVNQLVRHVDYKKIYDKIKGKAHEDPSKKANIKMVERVIRHIGSELAKNCDAWDYHE